MLKQFKLGRARCGKLIKILCIITPAFFGSNLCSLSNSGLISISHAESNGDDDVFDDKRGDVSINQDTLDKAETAFFKGLAAYRSKKYEAAAEYFKSAHKLVPYRDLLFNIARAHEELKQNRAAVKYYKLYLKTKPIDETQIIHRMRQLGVSQFETASNSKESGHDLKLQASPIPKVQQTRFDWLSWSILGGGIALVGTGAYFGLSALDSAEKARNARRNTIYDQAKSDAESEALIADIGVTLGLAVAAGGLYLLFTQPESSGKLNTAVYRSESRIEPQHLKKHTHLRISYTPLISDNMQGLALFGQF